MLPPKQLFDGLNQMHVSHIEFSDADQLMHTMFDKHQFGKLVIAGIKARIGSTDYFAKSNQPERLFGLIHYADREALQQLVSDLILFVQNVGGLASGSDQRGVEIDKLLAKVIRTLRSLKAYESSVIRQMIDPIVIHYTLRRESERSSDKGTDETQSLDRETSGWIMIGLGVILIAGGLASGNAGFILVGIGAVLGGGWKVQ